MFFSNAGEKRMVLFRKLGDLPAGDRTATYGTGSVAKSASPIQRAARFRRRALVITDTELRLIAKAASIGLRSTPKNG